MRFQNKAFAFTQLVKDKTLRLSDKISDLETAALALSTTHALLASLIDATILLHPLDSLEDALKGNTTDFTNAYYKEGIIDISFSKDESCFFIAFENSIVAYDADTLKNGISTSKWSIIAEFTVQKYNNNVFIIGFLAWTEFWIQKATCGKLKTAVFHPL